MDDFKYNVSVIVPIYNVEKFIARCVKSLMEQSLDRVEYIFIDDATPDNSIVILKEVLSHYPQRSLHCQIIKHEKNKGLPAARNAGLSLAKGQYIFHCDSDDFVEHDMLKFMYEKAVETQADIVWSDWYLSYGTKERYMYQPEYESAYLALKGILAGEMKYNVWNKLIKRTLYVENNIQFPSGHGMGEDMTVIKLFACANHVSYLHKAFYHYVKMNDGAMTMTWCEKHLSDLKYNVNETEYYIKSKYKNELDDYLSYFKLCVKLPFLISTDFSMYKLWEKWYDEANRCILKNKTVCVRTKILQWMAWKKQYWFVWLYNMIIQKFVYRIILGYR